MGLYRVLFGFYGLILLFVMQHKNWLYNYYNFLPHRNVHSSLFQISVPLDNRLNFYDYCDEICEYV